MRRVALLVAGAVVVAGVVAAVLLVPGWMRQPLATGLEPGDTVTLEVFSERVRGAAEDSGTVKVVIDDPGNEVRSEVDVDVADNQLSMLNVRVGNEDALNAQQAIRVISDTEIYAVFGASDVDDAEWTLLSPDTVQTMGLPSLEEMGWANLLDETVFPWTGQSGDVEFVGPDAEVGGDHFRLADPDGERIGALDVWLDEKDRPLRIETEFPILDSDPLTKTTTFTDWGADISIEPPAEDQLAPILPAPEQT